MTASQQIIEHSVSSTAPLQARLFLAHGAGAGMTHEWMERFSQELLNQAKGLQFNLELIRFNFDYMQQRIEDQSKRPPDRAPKLLNCYYQMMAPFFGSDVPLFIAGKSMGGRMASLFANSAACIESSQSKTNVTALAQMQPEAIQALPIRGVVCLGFPFHAPKSDKLKSAHLQKIEKPILIVQGTRDTMGTLEEVKNYQAQQLLDPKLDFEWLEDGDHSFKPRVKSGLTQAAHISTASLCLLKFMTQHL